MVLMADIEAAAAPPKNKNALDVATFTHELTMLLIKYNGTLTTGEIMGTLAISQHMVMVATMEHEALERLQNLEGYV